MEPDQTSQLLLTRILQKLPQPTLLEDLVSKLSGSELNTLLLELLQLKASQTSPAALLQQYRQNRFAAPSELPLLAFREFELNLMRILDSFGYQGLILSPAAPLGSCSVVAKVHQHKILSATRSTEVVADATNVLALEVCRRKKEKQWTPSSPADCLRLFTAHQHLRTPPVKMRNFSPHFSILAWVVSGKDWGECRFEAETLLEQLQLYKVLLMDALGQSMRVKFYLRGGYAAAAQLPERVQQRIESFAQQVPVEWLAEEKPSQYYQGLQFKVYLSRKGELQEVADGGLVDWTQQLLQNKKERLLISGLGTELLYKWLQAAP